MKIKCLHCGKEVAQTLGKRTKIYCDEKCRQAEWQKRNRESNPPTRKPGRPKKESLSPKQAQKVVDKHLDMEKKDLSKKKTFPPLDSKIKEKGARKEVKKIFPKSDRSKKAVAPSSQEPFMGHPIPNGLKGIELSIWKAEIKEKHSK